MSESHSQKKYGRMDQDKIKGLLLNILLKPDWKEKMFSLLKKYHFGEDINTKHMKYGAVKQLTSQMDNNSDHSRRYTVKMVNIAKSCKSKPELPQLFSTGWDLVAQIQKLECQLTDFRLSEFQIIETNAQKIELCNQFDFEVSKLLKEVVRHPGRRINNKFRKIDAEGRVVGLVNLPPRPTRPSSQNKIFTQPEPLNFASDVVSFRSDSSLSASDLFQRTFGRLKVNFSKHLHDSSNVFALEIINAAEKLIESDIHMDKMYLKSVITTLEQALKRILSMNRFGN